MYYWLLHPTFGVPAALRPLAVRALAHAPVVAAITWGSIVLELLLFCGLFATRAARKVLLLAGIVFHFGIMVLMGLGTFSIVMWAALILYLRPVDAPFALVAARRAVSRLRFSRKAPARGELAEPTVS